MAWSAQSISPSSIGELLSRVLGQSVARHGTATPATATTSAARPSKKLVNVTDLSLVAANHRKPGMAQAVAPVSGSNNLPAWLNSSSNLFGNSNSDLVGLLGQILGNSRQTAAPVDPNQSELYRQQAEQIKLQNDSARQLNQGRIDMGTLVNARNRFPDSNIGSLTYGMSPASTIDSQISALRNNGGYSTGWYGSMWPRTPWT